MDDTATDIIAREKALADFDHARDDFEDAFGRAPDEALGYKPEGDDYSIGYLLAHITGTMRMYSGVAAKIHEAAYGEVRLGSDDPPQPPSSQIVDREAALAEMETVHDTLAGKLRELAYENFSRKAPVYYPGSTDPYPTGAADILGWVAGHYKEHIPHIAELLAGWEKTK